MLQNGQIYFKWPFYNIMHQSVKLFLRLNALTICNQDVKNWNNLTSQGMLAWKFYRLLYFYLVSYTKWKLAWPDNFFATTIQRYQKHPDLLY